MSDTSQSDSECRGRARAAFLLASGRSVRATATEVGVSPRTVFRWLKHPSFKAKVDATRDRLVSRAVGDLARGMTAGATVLRGLLRSEDEPTKLKAARAILELGTKMRENLELQRRIEALELAAAKGGQQS